MTSGGHRASAHPPWYGAVTTAAVLLGMLLLGACAAPPLRGPEPARTQVVPINRVVEVFQDICIDTAPGFEAARDRFAAHGLTREAGGDIIFHTSGTLSVRVQALAAGNEGKTRCSVVYEDPNRYLARERIDRMIAEISHSLGEPRRAQFAALDGVRRQGRAWIFRADGRPGSLLDVPYAGGANLGVLILQFPDS